MIIIYLISLVSVPTEDTTGQGKLTVGKLYGGVLIYEIWKTTRFSNLEILAKMEEEMEEKEKLERGEVVEKKTPSVVPSEGEKTEKTVGTEETQIVADEEELTETKVDDRLKEIKNDLETAIPRDTSYDKLEMSKRRMDQAYREEQRYSSGMWDQWDGWHPPPPVHPPSSGHQTQHHHGYNHHPHHANQVPHNSQYHQQPYNTQYDSHHNHHSNNGANHQPKNYR